ncbi:acetyltransferase [Planctomycetota bacterium]|nr:acetyltransferase [Planctomycetota bacterium]
MSLKWKHELWGMRTRNEMMEEQKQSRGALLVYGAGGHGHVVAETAKLAGYQVLGFVDDEAKVGDEMSLPLFSLNDERVKDAAIIVGVGHNLARRRLTEDLIKSGRRVVNVVHPDACLSESVRLGQGVFVGAMAVVNCGAFLDDGAIVNSSSIVEHHCVVGMYSHVGPGAAMGGEVKVGKCAMIGLGARVLPRVKVGAYATVGGGAVVVKNVNESLTVVGVPAEVMRQSSAV